MQRLPMVGGEGVGGRSWSEISLSYGSNVGEP